ncbi:MAG: TraR/DksA C4-type zinc finger protein [Actinomycetota bacterium]
MDGPTLDQDAVRRELERELTALSAEMGDLTLVTRDPDATIGFGKRVGEGTTEAITRIERVGAANALQAKLADVRRALAKLDEGTYGICDRCGRMIPVPRLEARPASVLCAPCSAAS